ARVVLTACEALRARLIPFWGLASRTVSGGLPQLSGTAQRIGQAAGLARRRSILALLIQHRGSSVDVSATQPGSSIGRFAPNLGSGALCEPAESGAVSGGGVRRRSGRC